MAQKRLLTWILLVIGGAMAIFAALLAYVAMTFDVNDYKDRLSKTVTEKYQRTLTINGDLALSVFPNVEITLPHTSLTEPESQTIAAEVNGVRVSLALMPLVSHEIRVGEIVLDGLRAVVIKEKDGTMNFDDLTGGKQRTKKHAKSESKESGKELASFDIDGIRITDSSVTYRDLGTGKETSLSKINLTVGRLAALSAVPLDLSAHCESKEPSTSGNLTVRGDVTLDPKGSQYGAESLTLTYDGTVKDSPLTAEIKGDGLAWSPSAFSAKTMTATTTRGGKESAEINLTLSGAHGSPQAVEVDRFSAKVRSVTAASGKSVSVEIDSPLTAKLDSQTYGLKKIAGQIKVENPAAAAKLIEMAITGNIEVKSKEEKVTGAIAIKMDDSTVDSQFAVTGFTKPAITIDIVADTLDLDRYSAQSPPDKSTKKEAATPEKETPIDLSALKGFSLTGGIKVGTLQVHGIKAKDVVLKVLSQNGVLHAAPLTASLYEGKLDAKASVDANANKFSFAPTLTGIQVGPLLRDAAKLDKLEGKGNVAFDVTSQGTTVTALKQALAGSGSVKLTDGEIKGFDYGKRLTGWRDKLTGLGTANEGVASSDQEKTAFSELSATFVIAKGVATNNDLSVKAPLVRLGGAGAIDIGHDSLDYTVKASVVNTLSGQGGKSLSQTKDLTIPVRVHGPYDKIAYEIRWAEVSSEALKGLAAPKIEEQKKLLEEKAPEQLKGTLQGLFKR